MAKSKKRNNKGANRASSNSQRNDISKVLNQPTKSLANMNKLIQNTKKLFGSLNTPISKTSSLMIKLFDNTSKSILKTSKGLEKVKKNISKNPKVKKILKASKSNKNKDNKPESKSNILKLGKSAIKIAGNIGDKLGSPLISVGKQGMKLAADLEDTNKAVKATFEGSAGDIDNWSKNASKNFGLSELQAKQFSSSMGEVLKTTGLPSSNILKMSKNLTQLTGDFSSFYNISQDDAFKKIQSAVSGDEGALKDLGINMSEAGLQSYALSKGIKVSYSQMNEASKAQLRYDYLMANTRKAQNDFSSSSGSFSNQIKLLKINFDQLKGNLMSAVLPSFSKCLKAVNDFMNGLNNSEAIKKIQGAIAVLFNKISTVLPNILNLAAQLVPIIANIFEAISKSSILDEISSIVSKIIDSVISYIPTIVTCIQNVFGAIKTVIDFITNNWSIIGPILAGVIAAVGMIAVKSILIPNIISGIISAIGGMSTVLGVLSGAIGFLASPFGIAVLAAGALVTVLVLIHNNIGTICTGLSKLANRVKDFFKGFASIAEKVKAFPMIGGILNFATKSDNSGMKLFADGGIANRPSIFGEAGPEMAIPLKPTARNIGLLNQTAQVLGVKQGDGGPNVTINLTINSADGNPRTIAGAAEDAIVGVIEKYFGDKARVAYGQ